MSSAALVAENKYEGKYVALESFTSNHVVASGKNPAHVLNAAEKKGIASPVIIFVPKEDITYIY